MLTSMQRERKDRLYECPYVINHHNVCIVDTEEMHLGDNDGCAYSLPGA